MIFSYPVSAFMNTMVRKAAALVVVFFLAAAPALAQQTAQQTSQDVRALLEQRDKQIKLVLGTKSTFTQDQRERLMDLINGFIDFRAMAAAALGSHWADLTAAQKTEFVDVFSEIVRSQSLSDLDVYRSKVTYDSIEVEDDAARVLTTTVYKDVPARVEYLLGYTPKLGWQAHDIILDDVSTVEGYARSFQNVIRKKGFDALMTSLRKKLDRIEANS